MDNDFVYAELTINNKTLKMGTGLPYRIVSIEGLESSDIEISKTSSALYDGDIGLGTRIASRLITIELKYRDINTIQSQREWLINFMNPHKVGEFYINHMGVERKISCKVKSFKCRRANIHHPLPVLIILDCEDPYFKDAVGFSTNIATKIPLFTVPFAIPKNKSFAMSARSIQQELLLINNGARESGFIAQFTAKAQVKTPQLMNIATGEFIKVPITMQQGHVLTINTNRGNKKIDLNGQNINNLMDRQSTFFQLVLGENTIKYSADEGYSNLDVYFHWYPEYLGV